MRVIEVTFSNDGSKRPLLVVKMNLDEARIIADIAQDAYLRVPRAKHYEPLLTLRARLREIKRTFNQYFNQEDDEASLH